jgi:RNA polymerase sigma-70 factor (ECF subfamily)
MVALPEPEISDERRSRARFLALLEPVYARLEAYAFAITDSGDDARDLVSETVLRALEGFGRVQHDAAFLSYLFTIAGRIARRGRWRRRLFAVLPEEHVDALPSHAISPEVAADIALVRDALERLPAKMREAVMLHEVVGLPLAEIAAIQGGSLAAAKVRVHRARRRLAAMLGVDATEGAAGAAAAPPQSTDGIHLLAFTSNSGERKG